MGGAFGLFLSGLDSPVTREKMTARQTLRDMGQKSKSYAKNFAMIGLLFAGTECALESVSFRNVCVCLFVHKLVFHLLQYRGESGMSTSVMAGCAVGGVIGLRGTIIISTQTGISFRLAKSMPNSKLFLVNPPHSCS